MREPASYIRYAKLLRKQLLSEGLTRPSETGIRDLRPRAISTIIPNWNSEGAVNVTQIAHREEASLYQRTGQPVPLLFSATSERRRLQVVIAP